MPNRVEGRHPAEFVIAESPGDFSRENITVIAGQNLTGATVLGLITASGKYTTLNPAAADGSQNAAGILRADCNATSADTRAVAYVRDVTVNASDLNWGTLNAGQITTAKAQLVALGIIPRNAI